LPLVRQAIDRAEKPNVSDYGDSGDRQASKPVIYFPVQDYGSEDVSGDIQAVRLLRSSYGPGSRIARGEAGMNARLGIPSVKLTLLQVVSKVECVSAYSFVMVFRLD
jgi:hypothetical protein